MCGIAGVVMPFDSAHGALVAMADALRHRGPDSDGFHERAGVGLTVRRLRVIDLATGDQPIRSACTGATIVYNGELYNFRELRSELEAKGHHHRTASDTEVVLHFYEEYGVGEMHRLNGIFAFAIDDPARDTVVLVRDQLGVKPLYVARVDGRTAFASEPKALFASGVVPRDLDRAGLGAYLSYGHSVGETTVYRHVRKLRAGHALEIGPDRSKLIRYWSLAERARRWSPDAEAPLDEIDSLIDDAVRRNMIADVPVGAFLSGGLDSSLVTALMSRYTSQLRTYSVGFGERDDELPDALRIASAFGTEHSAITLDAVGAARFLQELPRVYDEPFADAAALPTMAVALRARQDVTVVLTGEGGDELFGGYRRYVAEQLASAARVLPQAWRAAIARSAPRVRRARRAERILRALAVDGRAARWTAWKETFDPQQRASLLGEPMPQSAASLAEYERFAAELVDVADDATAMMAHEVQTWLVDAYLEKVDKATMAASLEARVPLLDPRLVEFMALAPRHWRLDRADTKVALRKVASRYLPSQTLRKRKKGFGPPYERWLRTSLAGRLAELHQGDAPIGDHLDRSAVSAIVQKFETGYPLAPQVWALLVLDEWAKAERVSHEHQRSAPQVLV